MVCPHCGKQPDGCDEKVEGYTIVGRTGATSRSKAECGWCDGQFEVEEVEKDVFVVSS